MSDWPAVELQDLLCVKSELEDVVQKGEEGGEGEGADEDGDEPKLDHHLEVLLEQTLSAPFH